MIQINLFVGSRYPVNRSLVRRRVTELLTSQGVTSAQVDISVVGKRKIKQLNESELNHKGSTDVLSFPQHEKGVNDAFPLPNTTLPHLGDVVVCYPAALENARRFGKLVDDQLCQLVEHGLMHLLGYHHD